MEKMAADVTQEIGKLTNVAGELKTATERIKT